MRDVNPKSTIVIDYTNWNGTRRDRVVCPLRVSLTSAPPWHPDISLLLLAHDLETNEIRWFAVNGIHKIKNGSKETYETVRVYNNLSYTTGKYDPVGLWNAVIYNATYRPGTAFFVNGACVQAGYLTNDECEKIEQLLKNGSLGDIKNIRSER